MAAQREPQYLRRLFAGLAAFCLAAAGIALLAIFSQQSTFTFFSNKSDILDRFRLSLSYAVSFSDLDFQPGEDPYGGAIESLYVEKVTLISEDYADLPVEERQFTVEYWIDYGDAQINGFSLSPSGARFTLRTGLFSWETVQLPADENRFVWKDSARIGSSSSVVWFESYLLYYDGGNEQIENLLQDVLGDPIADGQKTDPPVMEKTLSNRLRWFIQWEYGLETIYCLIAVLLGIFFLILALRPSKMDPAAASDWFVSRMKKAGVPLAPYGRVVQGPLGKLPGELSFHAWLPAYSAGDIRRGEWEAERQLSSAFPENLLAVSFFSSSWAAKKAAGAIAPSGDRLKEGRRPPLAYTRKRLLYRRETMIIYYAGKDERIHLALQKCCGKPFAGTGVKREK